MATTVKADRKAGFCQWCRQGDHGVCASNTCKCTQVIHRNRPKFGQAAEVPRNGGGVCLTARCTAHNARCGVGAGREHHDDGEGQEARDGVGAGQGGAGAKVKPKPPGPAERAKVFLDAIVEAQERDWHRIALFATGPAAGQVRKSLERAYPDEWEWKAGRDSEGRPAVFVRWLGTGAE